jgi:hypothetical protein
MWPKASRAVWLLAGAALCAPAWAYTAAGDRVFPATVVLPQIGPSDEAYVTASTLPQDPALGDTRDSTLAFTIDKTITDQFSVTMTETYSINETTIGTREGWQNFDAAGQYVVVVNPVHEFLLSVGVDQNFGGTGAARVGASGYGSTTPEVFLGKGLGDYDIGLLRPLAIAGYAGFQVADGGAHNSAVQSGFVVEYSFAYLESKVAPVPLPGFLRSTTLMCEFAFSNPVAENGGKASVLVAPGFNYAGQGWDVGVEALVPASGSAGRGLGFIAQLHFSLDYLLPDSVGQPLL